MNIKAFLLCILPLIGLGTGVYGSIQDDQANPPVLCGKSGPSHPIPATKYLFSHGLTEQEAKAAADDAIFVSQYMSLLHDAFCSDVCAACMFEDECIRKQAWSAGPGGGQINGVACFNPATGTWSAGVIVTGNVRAKISCTDCPYFEY